MASKGTRRNSGNCFLAPPEGGPWLVQGTVWFGIDCGIANRAGKMSPAAFLSAPAVAASVNELPVDYATNSPSAPRFREAESYLVEVRRQIGAATQIWPK